MRPDAETAQADLRRSAAVDPALSRFKSVTGFFACQPLCSSPNWSPSEESHLIKTPHYPKSEAMSRFTRSIRSSVQFELNAASHANAHGEAEVAFRHLERAHVLGQAATVEHVRVRWRMFRWATGHRKAGEALGQLLRLVAAALMTGIGWLPEGNTGGANVSGFRRMPIPPDLQRAMDAAREVAPGPNSLQRSRAAPQGKTP
jgi:hypothetical protein